MPSPIIANAYLIDGGNCFRAIPSSPGRRVEFRANTAAIRDERDLIACLRHPGVQVDVQEDYVGWIAEKMNACGTGVGKEPTGEVHLPKGFSITGEPGQYEVVEPAQYGGAMLIEVPDPNEIPLPDGLGGEVWNPPSEPPRRGRPPGSKNLAWRG